MIHTLSRLRHLLVCLALLCACLHAQRAVAQSPFLDRQMGVRYLGMKAGLPKNHVEDMLTDSHGFVWIATAGGGLVRYDGYRFRAVDDGASGSKASRKMAEDGHDRLWVVYDEHTTVISLRTLQPTVPAASTIDLRSLLAEPAGYVLRDSLKRMWLVTRTHINLLTFDKQGNVIDRAQCSYTSNNPATVLSDVMGDGRVWANIDGGVYALEKQGDKLVKRTIAPAMEQLRDHYVPTMMRRDDKVWLGTNLGLYAYNLKTRQLTAYRHDERPTSLAHDFCSSLTVDTHGRLIVGTLAGVDVMTSDDGTFAHWNTHSSFGPLSSDFVDCMLTLGQQLWVGTESGGVVQLSPLPLLISNYAHSADPASLATNLVNAMWAAPDGSLWVGTVEGGLNFMAAGTRSFTHYTTANSALPHNTVSTLAADSNGRLWVGTWGGGVCYVDLREGRRIVPIEVDDSHRNELMNVGALAFDERNNGLWIGSNAGMFFYDIEKRQVTDPFVGNREVRGCIGSIITRDGHLWMGSIYGARVVDLRNRRYDGSFTMRPLVWRLDKPESKIVDHITSFCEASDGTLWLGSYSYGLYRRTLDSHGKEHFEAITTDHGLPNNGVKGIVEDGRHRLWITTDHGLAIYDPKTHHFTTYGESDGLPSTEFYWNSIVTQGSRMFLGSPAGLSIVEGENIPPIPVRLHFTGLSIDNRPILADGEHLDEDIAHSPTLTLHESERSLVIDFSALVYGEDEQGAYSYRLRGLSDEWTTLPAGDHSVRFSSLAPGSYTLEVRYTSASNVSTAPMATLDITVRPYFYRAWWFRMLMAVAVFMLLVWIYKRRLAHIRRDEAERQLAPIRKELEESLNPEEFRDRIAHILNNEVKMRDSISKSVEADKEKMSKIPVKTFIDQAAEIMEQHYMDSDFGIDEFCAAIGMSRTLVNKHLNQEAGVPLSQFIRNYRLNMARQLLLKNKANRNITEIAFSVGFNDPKYFTRCFTKTYGVSPSSFGEEDG